MEKDENGAGGSAPLTAEQKIQRLQFLNCQMVACQKKLEIAAGQFAYAQAVLAEARDQLEVTQQALEQAAAEI